MEKCSLNYSNWEDTTPILVWPNLWRGNRNEGYFFTDFVQVYVNLAGEYGDLIYSGDVHVVNDHGYSDEQEKKTSPNPLTSTPTPPPPSPSSRHSHDGDDDSGGDDMVMCDTCGERFSGKSQLAEHVAIVHNQQAVSDHKHQPTQEAEDEATLWRLVQRDLDDVNRNGRMLLKKCSSCGKRFERKGDLKRHLIEHILGQQRLRAATQRGGGFDCLYCGKRFERVDAFKADLRLHLNLTSYLCNLCDKSFSDSSNFSKHKKVHGMAAMQCDVCHRKFNTAKMMAAHMLHHRTAPPSACHHCPKTFSFESQRRKHAKAAHGTFSPVGKRSSVRPPEIAADAGGPVSAGFRPAYGCGACGERFLSLRDKWTHAWRAHGERRARADCWHCAARFRIISELRAHLTQQHGCTYTCKQIRERQSLSNVSAAVADPTNTTTSHILHYEKF